MPSYPVRSPKPKANLVQNFRGEARIAVPLHPLEHALVVVAIIHLCFLPWAFGARTPWAQIVSLGLAVLAFVIALWPRRYSGELAPEGDFTLHTWPRLLRFPPFWLGLGFCLYIVIGALNPSYERMSNGSVWYLKPLEHIDWLPSGLDAPFEIMNAWRTLIIVASVWLLACSLWTAITRRTAIQSILTAVVINGAILSLVAILQKMTGANKILWFLSGAPEYFHGTFYYKNHAAAYFNLTAIVSAGLMIWHHIRGLRHLERSSPSPVFAFGFIVIGSCVFMSGSRTGMILLTGYILIMATTYLIWRLRRSAGPSNRLLTVLATLAILGFVATAIYFLNLDKSIDQIRRLANEDKQWSVEARIQARDATYELFRDQPLTGWGAGSFRHAFPSHQQNYPDIFRGPGRRYFYWEHAHNDYVQALAEFGIIGFALPVLALLWLIVKLCRLGGYRHPAFLLTLLGLGLTLCHSWVDFQLYNACILTTFGAIAVLLVRWAELEINPGNITPSTLRG